MSVRDWKIHRDRLHYYNKWLMDRNRPLDQVFPGYPPNLEISNRINELENSIEINELDTEFGAGFMEDSVTTQKSTRKKSKKNNKLANRSVTVAILDQTLYNANMKTMNQEGKTMKSTNLSKATEIVKDGLANGVVKSLILDRLVEVLGITRSNAFVYFTKATKALGPLVEVPKREKKAKVEKTEIKPIKRSKARIKEIENVINELKKTQATATMWPVHNEIVEETV